MKDQLEEVLNSVLVLIAQGRLGPVSLQEVAKTISQTTKKSLSASEKRIINDVLTSYYSNLGLGGGRCGNCGPPGWHGMHNPK